MKLLSTFSAVALASCATTTVTTRDAKGAIVTTMSTQPAEGVIPAIETAIASALDALITGLIGQNQN